MDEQRVIEEFLGGRPTAAQLHDWKEVLRQRLKRLLDERRSVDGVPARLDGEIMELQQQIAALEREELITEFVEDSVRATLTINQIAPEDLEE